MTKEEAMKRIVLLLQKIKAAEQGMQALLRISKMFPIENMPEAFAAPHSEAIRNARENLERLGLDREALELGIAALMGPVSLPTAEVA